MLRFSIGLVFILLSGILVAQEGFEVRIRDAKTREPVPFANICFEQADSGKKFRSIGDQKGTGRIRASGRGILSVSVLGYKPYQDTVMSGQQTVLLIPRLFDLDEVVVTAQFGPRRVDQSIYRINVINSRLIAEKSVSNASELLAKELNLRINYDPSLGSAVTLNGLTGEHVIILVDGVPVIGRMNGNIDLTQLNLNNVDHVEIVEGPMSVQYGSNALAGAINIITREENRNRFGGGLKSYFESVGVYNFSGDISLKRESHDFYLNAGRNFFSGYPDTSRNRLWKPREQYSGDIYYAYRKNRFRMKARMRAFRERIRNKGPLLPPYFETAFDSWFITRRYSGRLSLDYDMKEYGQLEFLNSYSRYSRQKTTCFTDLTTLTEQITADASQQDTSTFDNWILRGTWNWNGNNGRTGFQLGYDLNYESGTGKRILNEEQGLGDYALFASLNQSITDQLSIQPGARVAWNTKYKPPLVVSLNLKYDPLEYFSIRTSYARGFRAPSLKELFLYFMDINHNIRGNPDLKAERSHNFNFSLDAHQEWNNHQFKTRLALFNNNIQNSITLAVDSALVYSYVNVNEVRSIGGNLEIKYKYYPRLELSAGLARTGRLSSVTGKNPSLDNYYFSTDFTSSCRYFLIRSGWKFSLFYKYTGKYPQYYLGSDDQLVEGYIDSFHSMDVTMSKFLFDKKMTITAGAKNIFNVTEVYASAVSTGVHSGGQVITPVGWGRTWFVGVEYNFGSGK